MKPLSLGFWTLGSHLVNVNGYNNWIHWKKKEICITTSWSSHFSDMSCKFVLPMSYVSGFMKSVCFFWEHSLKSNCKTADLPSIRLFLRNVEIHLPVSWVHRKGWKVTKGCTIIQKYSHAWTFITLLFNCCECKTPLQDRNYKNKELLEVFMKHCISSYEDYTDN